MAELSDGLLFLARNLEAARRSAERTVSLEWATVVAGAGQKPWVVLESDTSGQAREVTDVAAGPVVVGARVLCVHHGPRLTLLAVPPNASRSSVWNVATLTGGWRQYGASAYNMAGYRRTSTGWALRGMIADGAVGEPAFRLPEPLTSRHLLTGSSWDGSAFVAARIDVLPSGDVIPSSGANPDAWVSLDGITIHL